MSTENIVSGKKLIFSGEVLRQYLSRKGITYKMAAYQLGVNKNTVAKAVRGGNVTVLVLLKVCNRYGLNINDHICSCNEVAQQELLRTRETYWLTLILQELLPQEYAPLCDLLRKLLTCLEK